METAKTLYDEDLTFNTDQWSADWSANMSGDGVDSNAALAIWDAHGSYTGA